MGAKPIVPNVSRLTRNPDFIGTCVEAGAEVEFGELPNVDGRVGKSMLQQILSLAELEADMTAERTRKHWQRLESGTRSSGATVATYWPTTSRAVMSA